MKINKYFGQYLNDLFGGNIIELDGLLLMFEYNGETGNMEWVIENPKDVSYLTTAVLGYIDDLVTKFSDITASQFYSKITNKQKLLGSPKKIYISDEDYNLFYDLAVRVTKYKYDNVQATMNIFDMEFGFSDDMLEINLSIKLINPIDPETKEKLTYSEVSERLVESNEDDSWGEYIDGLFVDLINQIYHNHPTIFNNASMIIIVYPMFYTDRGQRMRHW